MVADWYNPAFLAALNDANTSDTKGCRIQRKGPAQIVLQHVTTVYEVEQYI